MIGEHGKVLVEHLEGKSPIVGWEAKTTLEQYAIASAESRGWFNCLREMIKVITPTEEKS